MVTVAVFGVLGLFFAIIAAIVVASSRATKRNLAAASELRGRFDEIARRAGSPGGPSFRSVVGERKVSCTYSLPMKNSPATLTIAIDIENDHGAAGAHAADYRASARRRIEGCPKILLRGERRIDRFGKMVRVNRETQTGDASFDRRVYIESDAKEDDVREVLAEEGVRQAVVRLLDRGFTNVNLHESARELKVTLANPSPAQVEAYDATVADLVALADGLPGFSGSAEKIFWTFGAKVITPAVLAMVVGFITVISVSSIYRTVTSDLQVTSVLVGLGAWCLLVPAVAFAVRGRSNSLRIFIAVILTQLVAFPTLMTTGFELLNGLADTAPVAHHVATVRKKWTTSGKNTTYYHLSVSSWRRDLSEIELSVDWAVYRDVAEGAQLRVDTSPGALGWEWIDAIGS